MGSRFLKFAPVMIWFSDTFPKSAGVLLNVMTPVPSLSTTNWETGRH